HARPVRPAIPLGQPSFTALVCAADDGSWDAMLTIIRAQRVPVAHQVYNKPWSRDPRTGYDLTSAGKVLYELQIHEIDDGGTGHGPRPLVVFELFEQAQAVADALIQWTSQGARTASSARPERRMRLSWLSPRLCTLVLGAVGIGAFDRV